jgi:hypothetical protein
MFWSELASGAADAGRELLLVLDDELLCAEFC